MEIRNQLLLTSFGVIALVGALHSIALRFFFYWQFWWFDILMHFLGGFCIALITLWGLMRAFDFSPGASTFVQGLFFSLGLTLIVGIGWEIFEGLFGLYDTTNYPFDTSVDLLMDLVGAFAAYKYAVWIECCQHEVHHH